MNAIYPLTLYYDAACPICALEMDHLRSRNEAGRLSFVDISAPGFDPATLGVSLGQLNAEIHALSADGQVMRGVQVLRLAYEAVGLGWVLRPVGFGPLRGISESAYRWFAANRQTLSRLAAPLIRAVRARRARQTLERMRRCQDGACAVNAEQRRTS